MQGSQQFFVFVFCFAEGFLFFGWGFFLLFFLFFLFFYKYLLSEMPCGQCCEGER